MGEYVLQASNIDTDEEYFVHVESNRSGLFAIGNYEMNIGFSDQQIVM